ncbi:MOSC domain-containing protein [Acidovorax sp. NCPPB 3576]|uniref:MOSC domain-containing protein n=1 Tax=Acidovorax sp. NCPPB 3576 TaxID=2940488 RepID=UPI002349F5B3|nr:MOSC domain-containing protein [Acidovorax sp. NCPPB 3576]WCM89258.1 MOSC domain-containing protein [Acidovorax sp. NCPPB 3576]
MAEQGILGDRHANRLSPRQVLLAGTDAYRDLQLPPLTLSENLLIDLPTAGLCSGSLLKIGPEVVLWITFQCEPCARLERRQPGVVKALKGRRGVLARVLQGGSMRVGDAICQGPAPIPPMSDDWKARVAHVVRQIPAGKRVEYRQLADLAGVAKGYCRAFPRVLNQLCPDVARRAQASSVVMRAEQHWAGAELFDVHAHLSAHATVHARHGYAVYEPLSGE